MARGDDERVTTTDASTGFPEPTMEEHLQSYQTENCKNPLWCLDEGQPSPARASAQLCFAPATAPPYLLDRIGWVIAANFGDLTADSYLEVYTGTAAGPDQKLWELPLGPGEVSAVPAEYSLIPRVCHCAPDVTPGNLPSWPPPPTTRRRTPPTSTVSIPTSGRT